MASVCRNCGNGGVIAFCPVCGQEQTDTLPTVRSWLKAAGEELFTVSGSLPRSLRLLLIPGFLTSEWVEGRRGRYTRPFRLFLLSLAALLLASIAFFEGGDPIPYAEWFLRGIFVAWVPVLALMMRLAFGRQNDGPSLTPELVFSLHYHAFACFAAGIALAGADVATALGWASGAEIVVAAAGPAGIAYFFLAARRVYARGWGSTIVRGTLTFSMYGTSAAVGGSLVIRALRSAFV